MIVVGTHVKDELSSTTWNMLQNIPLLLYFCLSCSLYSQESAYLYLFPFCTCCHNASGSMSLLREHEAFFREHVHLQGAHASSGSMCFLREYVCCRDSFRELVSYCHHSLNSITFFLAQGSFTEYRHTE